MSSRTTLVRQAVLWVGPHVRPQKTDHAPKNGHGGGPRQPAGTSNVQCNAATENASPPPSQAEREVVRDFFTDWRSRARQNQETKPRVHAAVYVRPMRRGRKCKQTWHMCASSADGVSAAKFNGTPHKIDLRRARQDELEGVSCTWRWTPVIS
jgi:hypothetical protein